MYEFARLTSESDRPHPPQAAFIHGGSAWWQECPLGYMDGQNLYQFVDDTPVSKTDGSGLISLSVVEVPDWLNPGAPANIEVLQIPWYARVYKEGARWSNSQLARQATPPQYWEPDLSSGTDCEYVIKGPIQTYMHTLVPPVLQESAQSEHIQILIDEVNQLARAHEDHVIEFMQEVWGPPYKIKDFGSYEQELTREFNDRSRRVKQLVDSIEAADVGAIRGRLRDIENELKQ